ncbi:MAG: ferrous iron transport protein A [Magnetococcales bacterium]|nr:ferrous iron transport protein A [Magnetococcales bacterium]
MPKQSVTLSQLDKVKNLAQAAPGQSLRIVGLTGEDAHQRRLMAMGLVSGKEIILETRAPMGDPRIYAILGYRLTLRNDDARHVLVTEP